MKCLNVIVYYDNKEEVKKYIDDVMHIGNGDVDIAIVINSDAKKLFDEMIKDFPDEYLGHIFIKDYHYNVGYLNALLKTVKEIDIKNYKYIILSNTDILYPETDFFCKLMQHMYPQDIGCIAPSVYSPRKQGYSNPHYMERIPLSKLRFLSVVFFFPRLAKFYLWLSGKKGKALKTSKKNACYVYSPHGCYMIFTQEFIKRIIGFEYGVTLYSEESCIGELLLRYNFKCYYDNSIEVVHNESSVTGKMNYKKRFRAWRESLIYIINEFYTM